MKKSTLSGKVCHGWYQFKVSVLPYAVWILLILLLLGTVVGMFLWIEDASKEYGTQTAESYPDVPLFPVSYTTLNGEKYYSTLIVKGIEYLPSDKTVELYSKTGDLNVFEVVDGRMKGAIFQDSLSGEEYTFDEDGVKHEVQTSEGGYKFIFSEQGKRIYLTDRLGFMTD